MADPEEGTKGAVTPPPLSRKQEKPKVIFIKYHKHMQQGSDSETDLYNISLKYLLTKRTQLNNFELVNL